MEPLKTSAVENLLTRSSDEKVTSRGKTGINYQELHAEAEPPRQKGTPMKNIMHVADASTDLMLDITVCKIHVA
jgi:hypothetical protein